MRHTNQKAFSILSLFVGIFLLFSLPLSATIYYVDATTGDDGDSGLTEELAWETFDKVRNFAADPGFSAGDTIKFKRGETWSIGTDFYWTISMDGTSENYITIDAYGEGTKPIIDIEESLSGGWTQYGAAASVYTDTIDVDEQHSTVTNVRSVHPAGELSGSGTQVRAHFVAHSSQTTYIDGASIGKRDGSSDDYAAGTLVRLQFSSSDTAEMAAGTTLWSDWATLPQAFDDSVDYMTHHFQVDRGTIYWEVGTPNGKNDYYRITGDDDSQTVSFAGTAWLNGRVSVDDIEVKSLEDIWQKSYTPRVKRCRLDGVDSFQAASIGAIDGITYNWHWASNVLYVYATENPDTDYSAVKVSDDSTCHVFVIQAATYIKIQNLRIHGGAPAVYFYEGFTKSYIEINDCDFWYGYRGIRVIEDGAYTCNYITIDGNDFDTKLNMLTKVGAEAEMCGYDGLDIMNECNNWAIKNNTFTDWGHSAIGLVAWEHSPTQGVNNCVVENNVIDGTNSPYLRGFTTAGLEGKVTNNIFRYNIIKNTNVRDQLGGNNNEFYYNLIYHRTESPVTNKSNISEGLMIVPSEGNVCHDNKVYNNVFYDIFNEGILFGSYVTVDDNLVKNNIVMNAGQGGDQPNICLHYPAATGTGNVISNNCFYDSGTSDVINFEGTPVTVVEANAESEFSNNIASDPKFIDAANAIFRLIMASPCINAGTDVGLTRDYRGRSIRHAPDIGAYEDPTSALFLTKLFKYLKEKKDGK